MEFAGNHGLPMFLANLGYFCSKSCFCPIQRRQAYTSLGAKPSKNQVWIIQVHGTQT